MLDPSTILAAVGLLAVPASSDALTLVPADAFFVVHVESVSGLHDAVAASDYFRFVMGPDGALASTGLVELMEAETAPGFELDALFELLGSTAELDQDVVDSVPAEAVLMWQFLRGYRGSLTIYASGGPGPGQGLGFGVVMEPGGAIEPFVERLEGLFDQPPVWRERAGVQVATETDGPFEGQNAFVVQDGRHVVFVGADTSQRALEQLDRLTALAAGEERENLSQNPRWIESAAATAGLGQCRFFVDLVPIMGALRLDAFDAALSGDAPFDPSALVADLGLLDMRWIAARLHVGEGESLSFDIEMQVPENCVMSQMLDLSSGGVPTHFLERFSEGALRASALRFDVGGMADLVLDLVGQYAGDDALALEEQLDALPEMLGFDPLEDLVGQLSGEFAVVEYPSLRSAGDDLASGSLFGFEPTVVVGLRNARRFEAAVSDALAFAGEMSEEPLPIEELTRGGRSLKRVALPTGDMFFAFGADACALGYDRDTVLAALTPSGAESGPSALDDPALRRAFDEHPNAMMVDVTSTGPWLGSMFEAVGGLGALAAMQGGEVPRELLALGALGEEARTRFTGHATQVLERTPRGVRLHLGVR
jgi:hypothetical protein